MQVKSSPPLFGKLLGLMRRPSDWTRRPGPMAGDSSEQSGESMAEARQIDLLNQLVAGSANEQSILSEKLDRLVSALDTHSRLLNQLVDGSANEQSILNEKLDRLALTLDTQSRLLNQLVDGSTSEQSILNEKLGRLIELVDAHLQSTIAARSTDRAMLIEKLDQLTSRLETRLQLPGALAAGEDERQDHIVGHGEPTSSVERDDSRIFLEETDLPLVAQGARDAIDEKSISFESDFLYIAALPKSASSLMWLIVSCLQEESGRADPDKLPEPLPSPFAPLQFTLLDKMKRGGTLSGHAPLNYDTHLFLHALRSRYVIHLRHPADFIASFYCHGMDTNYSTYIPPSLRLALKAINALESPRWAYALSAIDHSALDRKRTPMDKGLSSLLRDGALYNAMSWMSDWLAHRDPARSIVSTYEALMSDFDATIERLCIFVRGCSIDADRLDYLRHVTRYVAESSRESDAARYPRGWTGKVGCFRQYFNEEHINIYNDVVGRFIHSHPNAAKLVDVYGDIMI